MNTIKILTSDVKNIVNSEMIPNVKKLNEIYDYFIFSQGNKLSCSVTAPISMIEYLRQKEGRKNEKLSVSFLYHNCLNEENKKTNSTLKASTVIHELITHGTCSQSKWSDNDEEKEPNHEAILDAITRIKHCNVEILEQSIDCIKYIIGFCERPIVCILDITNKNVFINDKETIQRNKNEKNVISRHSILLIGYDDIEKIYWFQNSYGENWGFNGFGKISYDCISLFKLMYSMDESCLKSFY